MKSLLRTSVSSITAAFALLAGASANAQELSFQNYNAIIFNNLNTNSNIFGRTWVGNDFTGSNSADFGVQLPGNLPNNDRTLVVGNNLSSGNPINVHGGSLYIDGSTNGRAVNFNTNQNGRGALIEDHSIDAATAAIRGYSIAQSDALRAMVSDSVVTYPSSQPSNITFTATPGSDGVAVFNVNAADVFSNPLAQSINLVGGLTTNVIINVAVSGGSVNFNQGNMGGDFLSDYAQGHVLWNFYNADNSTNPFTITIERNFNGAILAPYANINTSSSIDGLVVANNLTARAQLHTPISGDATSYSGYTAPVPEPGSIVFLVAAGGLLLIVRNRRLMA